MVLVRLFIGKNKEMICEASIEEFCDRFHCLHHIGLITDLVYNGVIDFEAYDEFKKDDSNKIICCYCPYQKLNSKQLRGKPQKLE